MFIETSAKTGYNVKQVCMNYAVAILCAYCKTRFVMVEILMLCIAR